MTEGHEYSIALIDHLTKGGGYLLALVLWHVKQPAWVKWFRKDDVK